MTKVASIMRFIFAMAIAGAITWALFKFAVPPLKALVRSMPGLAKLAPVVSVAAAAPGVVIGLAASVKLYRSLTTSPADAAVDALKKSAGDSELAAA